MDRLEIRRSNLYKQDKLYPLCDKEEESREYLFECKELENRISQAWEKIMKKIIIEIKKAMLKDKEKTKTKNIMGSKEKQIVEFGKKTKKRIFRSKQELFNFM